ncbi:MAG: hypothetical protein ACHQNE_02055, partial [Candidatus Kapaibacterium sp.]
MKRIQTVVARFPRLVGKARKFGKAGKPRHYIIAILLACGWPLAASAQDTINPYVIQQHNTIELHNTDVYYKPFLPPAPNCIRQNLSNVATMLLDSDGLNPLYPQYRPMVHASGETVDTPLYQWQPYGIPLGWHAVWQRLFQALPKADGTPTDIIAGGDTGERVIISKNEDVDFRASGRVILKSGFHARAGCFFHAYTDPHWDTAVFSDEFDDTAKFRNQWHVTNGWGSNSYPQMAECAYDSLVRLVSDTGVNGAHDGHALDLIMKEDTVNNCHCIVLGGYDDTCGNVIPSSPKTDTFVFASGLIRSCPFPYATRATGTTMTSWYAHTPYGKYEIREKIPHVWHHTNNWGGGWVYPFEYDINEADNNGDLVDSGSNMDDFSPDWGHTFNYGPYQGHFSKLGGTTIFVSSQPEWCLSNQPYTITINNVAYQAGFFGHGYDTLEGNGYIANTGWPSSLVNDTTDSYTFYYSKDPNCKADSLPWTVKYDTADHKWDEFYAGYHVNHAGDTLKFSKWNQPNSITLTTRTFPTRIQKTFSCHWEYNLNHGSDTGWLMLDFPAGDTDSVKTMAWSDFHNHDEPYSFTLPGVLYPVQHIPFNGNDTTGGYTYHTFAMEWLPHEVRYLIDSVVVCRFPDRLIPPGNPYYD